MGSSVVASIIEHLGFLNIPVRKLGLLDYLSNKIPKNSDYMINRFEKLVNKNSNFLVLGGVNVLDRNSNHSKKLIDKDKIIDELDILKKKKIQNPIELYGKLRCSYNNSILYKNINKKFMGHVEQTTQIHNHNPKELYNLLNENFDEFYVINIRRNFSSWLNSLFAQWHLNKNDKFKLKLINIRKIYSDYCNYNKFLNNFSGLEISFDHIFFPYTQQTIEKIVKYFGKKNNLNWKDYKYDLYGKLVNYNKTFTKRDDEINYLTKKTKELISESQKSNFKNNISLFFIYYNYIYSWITLKFRIKKIKY